ncbi:MAG: hypothetical protein ACRD8O_18185 [Bryobacteraceae bacterium]
MTTLEDKLNALPPERRRKVDDLAAEILAKEYRRKLRKQQVRPVATGGKDRRKPSRDRE